MYTFSPTLPNSVGARICCRLPLPLSRAASAIIWGISYIFNVKELRSTIAASVAKATGCSHLDAHAIGISGAIAFGRYVTDFAFFLHRPVAVIRKRVVNRTGFKDIHQLEKILKEGKGGILVSSNFSCFYYALTTSRVDAIRDMDLVIVQPSESVQGVGAQEFKRKISEIMGRDLTVIESGTLRAGIEMTAALRRGCFVACLVDFFPPRNTSLAITEFLNHPSCQPTGISSISSLTGAPVIPCFTFFEEGKYFTKFSDAIYPPEKRDDPIEILNMCNQIDKSLSSVILSRPADWAAWISVPNKWNTASMLLEQLEEQEDAPV
jgi:lauroyl/myristoyl acyltransferase